MNRCKNQEYDRTNRTTPA